MNNQNHSPQSTQSSAEENQRQKEDGMENRLINSKQASEMIGVPEKVLRDWRYKGRGPKFYKIGRLVRYKRDDIYAFIETHLFSSKEDVSNSQGEVAQFDVSKYIISKNPTVSEIISKAMPRNDRVSGVYFLIKDGTVVYVGQSKTVLTRIEKHDVDFDFWCYVPVDVERLDLVEAFWIDKLKPISNGRTKYGNIVSPIGCVKITK